MSKGMTTKEKFIGDILGSLRNKPCSFGHAVPTRMCSSCGPFPDPMVSLDVLLESQVRDLTQLVVKWREIAGDDRVDWRSQLRQCADEVSAILEGKMKFS